MDWMNRLALGFRQKQPVILQTEAAECGLACLAMVLNHHGVMTDLATVRSRHSVSMTGLTLNDLADMAREEGLGCRGLRLELEDLQRLRLPAILHWDMSHFVVLVKADERHITIHDPAIGERRMKLSEASAHFTGVALELWPDPGFQPREEKQGIKWSQLTGQVTGLWATLGQVLMFSLALEILALVSPLFMQWVIDHVLVAYDQNLLTTLALGFALLLIFEQGISLARSWLLMVIKASVSVQWRSNVFAHLTKLPLPFFQSRHLGDIVSRTGSIESIQETLTAAFVEALFDGLLTIMTLTLMFLYSPKLAWVSLLAVALYLIVRVAWYRPLYLAKEEALVRQAKEASHFLESVRGMRAIQLFGQQSLRQNQWQTLMVAHTNAELRIEKLQIYYQMVHGFLSGGFMLLIIWMGAKSVMSADFTVGMLMAFLSYRGNFDTRVTALIDKMMDLRMLRLHADRLSDIVLTPIDPACAPAPALPADAAEPAPPTIEIEQLRFRYSDKQPWILDGISFKIEPGEVIAITGRSGSGKTTLIHLLLGAYAASEGKILANGKALTSADMPTWRRQVATVMQDDSLFAGSIADNITFFDPKRDEAWMAACVEMAALDHDIAQMPMGFMTLIGDMGTTLSGGQKQRVLLARALYKRPRLLLLDEATSQLDVNAEYQVNAAVSQLDMTRIIVAHRPDTIAMAQRVIVLDEAQLIFDGDQDSYQAWLQEQYQAQMAAYETAMSELEGSGDDGHEDTGHA